MYVLYATPHPLPDIDDILLEMGQAMKVNHIIPQLSYVQVRITKLPVTWPRI